jgi:hypothetical protein
MNILNIDIFKSKLQQKWFLFGSGQRAGGRGEFNSYGIKIA